MTEKTIDFYSLPMPKLQKTLTDLGKEKFRAQQLYKWVYEKEVINPELMTNLSKEFRRSLWDRFRFELPTMVDRRISVDGTRKYLFDIGQGQTVEAVMIPADDRMTLCLSSEVGCNLACKFCFTGKQKLKRRLTAVKLWVNFCKLKKTWAILALAMLYSWEWASPWTTPRPSLMPSRFSNQILVLILEERKSLSPLRVLYHRFLSSLSLEHGWLSVSTLPMMKSAITLCRSTRNTPSRNSSTACKEHAEAAGDRVTFEYVMLKDGHRSYRSCKASGSLDSLCSL
jgi:23S rRNA (adenine2503-C2)-methyltransferase